MIDSIPEPSLMSLVSNKTPHFIALGFFSKFTMLTKLNHYLLRVKLAQQNGIYRAKLGFLFLSL